MPAEGTIPRGLLAGTVTSAIAILSSLRFAVGIALALSVACILGTVLEQEPDPGSVLEKYGPRKAAWILRFGLHDVFHTWWFVALMVLWNLSLVVCTTKKFIGAWPWAYRLTPKDAETRRRRGHMWGNWIFHVSLVAICLGSVAGAKYGWKELVKVPEGDSAAIPHTPWKIECRKFEVKYYPGTQQPKQFISDLSIVEGTKSLATRTIWVNQPWDFAYLRIYQASYGTDLAYRMNVTNPKTRRTATVTLRDGEETELPGGFRAHPVEFYPDFRLVGHGAEQHIESASDEPRNPALRIRVQGREKSFDDWVFLNPELARISGQNRATIVWKWLDIPKRSWTGLQVVKDPGVPAVWAGVAGLMVGLLFMLYLFPRHAPRLAQPPRATS